MLARFLSPDPYVQAPDYTQGFNRYSYCYNNPFKYTDPSGELQLGPFYASLNLGWGYGGGFYFGISAGVGIENLASAGISIGYNTSGSFTFSASVGAAGFYATAGFDTKGGWFAGAGWSAPLPSFGIVSFNTNLVSIGVNYSQNGGWSGNYMGAQISRKGVSFVPSVGVSITRQLGIEYQYEEARGQTSSDINWTETKEEFKFKTDEELNDFIYKFSGVKIGTYNIELISAYLDTKEVERKSDGWLYKVSDGRRVYGITKYSNFFSTSKIYLSRNPNLGDFINTINHEITHAYIYHKYEYKLKNMGFSEEQRIYFHEYNAYLIGQGYITKNYTASPLLLNGGITIIMPKTIKYYPPLFWNGK